MELIAPYLLFLGDAPDQLAAKTAQGIAHWRLDKCVGQLRLAGCVADLGLSDLDLDAAVAKGAKTLVIGVANAGGHLPSEWTDTIVAAIDLGLDVASGMHSRLDNIPEIKSAAERAGRRLIDVRVPSSSLPVGNGKPRAGRRMLTVGTDCSVGKMYATLAIEAEMKRRNISARFCATGQTGIFIAGSGVPVDAVAADFISGSVEQLTPACDPDHWDLIEGQGSLYHPSFAGVSLGLLHGAQPETLVLCHEPTRTHMRGLPHYPLPDLSACIEANLDAARLTSPHVRFVGVAVNTSHLPSSSVETVLRNIEDEVGLPAVDPVATGVAKLVEALTTP
jgi:uncharacterized NAD-dependent epimerase/dehydratase family protein